jgi:3-oxoacyl-[acyl-carrier protein] reductase
MKKVIITGCSGSVGAYLTKYFKRKKYKVIGIDQKDIKLKGIDFYKVNMANESNLKKIYKKILSKHKKIKILINTAGFIHNELILNLSKNFKTHSYSNWKKVIKNNLDLTFLNTKFFIDNFKEDYSNEKIIINFSSINSKGVIGQSAYSSAKAAIEVFTKVLSRELAGLNFRVTCIAPGYLNVKSTINNVDKKNLKKIIETIPLKKLGYPEDIVKGVDFIIKNKYFNGKTLNIDGGQ